MTMNLDQNLKILNLSLSILSKWIVPRLPDSFGKHKLYLNCITHWLHKIVKWVNNNGVKYTCKRAKTIRAITIAYIAKVPINKVEEFVSINKEGLPSDLGPLQLLAKGDNQDKKVLLTLLSVTKVFTILPDPNYESITKESTAKLDPFWDYRINRFFRWLHIRKGSLKIDFRNYHLSTKTSPNGGNALNDSLSEVLALKANMSLKESICTVGGQTLTNRLNALFARLKPTGVEIKTLRRVTCISDKEGKTRVVAILDYWSQTALRPLHNALLGVLRSLKSDMTYNQSGFTQILGSGPYFSFDLKDATDRFPIALQQKVLSYLTSPERAKAWASILIQKGYNTPQGDTVFYKAGQPMGAYSSWAAFALTHHIVVQAAAMETQKFPFTKYVLLGDDIVIADRDVAIAYKNFMMDLGVEFSATKTIVSDVLYEFASRIFLNGMEISPFSLRGVFESAKHPATIVEFLRTMHTHGWELLKEGNIPGQIKSLVRLSGAKRFYKRWDTLIDVFYALPLKAVVKNDNGLSAVKFMDDISCFQNQHIPRIRDALVEELRYMVERRIDEITSLHAEWAMALPPMAEFIRSDAGDMPIPPATIPIIGVWHELKRDARELANELCEYYPYYDYDIPLERWISDLTGISNTPNISKVLKERKHTEIILLSSSLILRAVKRARLQGLGIEEQGV